MIVKSKPSSHKAMPALALSAMLALSGSFALHAGSASASTVNTEHGSSRNWSGYVDRSKSGQSYSAVSGSWNVPSVTSKMGYGYSADWVGLGGATANATALEQTGTSSDVVNGQPEYSAWYEVSPAAETKVNISVHPGDHMYARVTVVGRTVTMSLSDQTTGRSVRKREYSRRVDTSSAEWIAEAPSVQTANRRNQVLPLADFRTVKFGNAYATAGGHVGAISDPSWTHDDLTLDTGSKLTLPDASGGVLSLPGLTISLPSSGSATPSNLSSNGDSFSVSYNGATSSSTQCLAIGLPFGARAQSGGIRSH